MTSVASGWTSFQAEYEILSPAALSQHRLSANGLAARQGQHMARPTSLQTALIGRGDTDYIADRV